MKEFILKMLIGMIMSTASTEQIVQAIEKLKQDLRQKVKETPDQWDDMAVDALLDSQDQILELANMIKDMVGGYVEGTETNIDDIIWEPLSQKLDEVIALIGK